MIWKRFALVLVRKSDRALRSARLALADGDNDGAVNRSYYAMFDVARAALLRAGVAEDRLPRTHNGVIEVFRQHAVQSGRIDPTLASELSRTQSHRIKADYTGIEIQPEIAAEAVANSELFVQTVRRAFDLDVSSLATEYDNEHSGNDDKVSESDLGLQPAAFEEQRRQARENWLRLRQQTINGEREIDHGHDAGRSPRMTRINLTIDSDN